MYGQEEKRYYLKMAAGPKWNLISPGYIYQNDWTFDKVGDKTCKTVFAEMLLGIPLTHYAHVETGLIINRYRYQERLQNRNSSLRVELPDVEATRFQMPLRLRTSFNLANHRLFLLTSAGIADVLAVFNGRDSKTFTQEYTFLNTGQIMLKPNRPFQEETLIINTSHTIYTHPLYFDLGTGLECFVTKNIALSGMVYYSMSTSGNPIYSSYTTTVLASDNQLKFDPEHYSLEQNILAVQATAGIQYYFKNNISTVLKPFEGK